MKVLKKSIILTRIWIYNGIPFVMNIHLQRELHCKSKMFDFFDTFIFHGTYLGDQDELEDKSHH